MIVVTVMKIYNIVQIATRLFHCLFHGQIVISGAVLRISTAVPCTRRPLPFHIPFSLVAHCLKDLLTVCVSPSVHMFTEEQLNEF